MWSSNEQSDVLLLLTGNGEFAPLQKPVATSSVLQDAG